MRHIKRIALVLLLAVIIAPNLYQNASAEDVITNLFNTLREKIAFYSQQSRVGDLMVGDDAPDFSLNSADGKSTVQLSSFEGEQDVVLIFGSYT